MVRDGGEDPELVGREGQKRTGQLGVSRSVCWKVGARATDLHNHRCRFSSCVAKNVHETNSLLRNTHPHGP